MVILAETVYQACLVRRETEDSKEKVEYLDARETWATQVCLVWMVCLEAKVW